MSTAEGPAVGDAGTPGPLEEPPRLVPVIVVLMTVQGLTLMLGGIIGVIFSVFLLVNGVAPADLVTALTGDPWFLVGSALVSQGAMGVVLWKLPGLLKDASPSLRQRLRWGDEPVRWQVVLLLFVGALCIGPLTVGVLDLLGYPKSGMLELFSKASQQSAASFAALVLVGAVMPGVLEELLFRGYVQTRFVERWGPARGIVATAAVFGLWHLDVRQGLFAMGVGCFIGWGAHRVGTIVPGAMAHLFNNLTSFVLSRVFGGAEDEASALPGVIIGAAVVLVLVVVALRVVTRPPRVTPATAPP